MALAGLGIALAPNAGHTAPPTTSAAVATTIADAWWFSPAESVVGPTAVLVQDVEMDGSELVVRYELRDLAPEAIGRMRTLEESNPFFASPREEPVVAPERWVLETVSGEYEGLSRSARTPAARFDVPDGFVIGTITGLRLESYRMRMPYVFDIEVEPIPGTTYELDEGFSFTIVRVLEQSSTTILQIDYLTPSDDFTAGEPTPVIISGVGPEWLSYNQRQAGGVFGGLQLIREGGDLPDTVTLRIRSTYWVPFETTTTIDLGGTASG
jgi:hypothetical protein